MMFKKSPGAFDSFLRLLKRAKGLTKDLLSIPTVSTTAESTHHWNSRIDDRIELCNKKMYGT